MSGNSSSRGDSAPTGRMGLQLEAFSQTRDAKLWEDNTKSCLTQNCIGSPSDPGQTVRLLTIILSELPREHEMVAYCHGPYCVLSFEAVAALRAHGFNVRRFEDGFPEWKAAGLPIEVAA
jgi:rhodanese-related sulfurtransferase